MNGGYINKSRLWFEYYSKYKICEGFLIETNDKLDSLKRNLQVHENDLEQNSIKLDDWEKLKNEKHLEKNELRSKLSKTEIELEELNRLVKNYKQLYKRKLNELDNLKFKLDLILNRPEINETERLIKIATIKSELEILNEEYKQVSESCNQAKLKFKGLKLNLKENLLKQEIDLDEKLKHCEFEFVNLKNKTSNYQSTIKVLEDSISQMRRKNGGSSGDSVVSGSQTSSKSSKDKGSLDLVDKKKKICQLEQAIEQIQFKSIEIKFNLEKNLQLQKTFEDEINLYQNRIEQLKEKASKYMKFDSKTLAIKLNEYQNELVEIGSQHTPIMTNELGERKYLHIYNELNNYYELMDIAIQLFNQVVTVERTLDTLKEFFVRFQQIFSWFREQGKIQVEITLPEDSIVNNFEIEKYNFNLNRIWSSMSVSFNGEVPRLIDYLSGGQKTILSLCYLLSVLTMKPQPFLLIDETDQNLDQSTCHRLGLILKKNFSHRSIQFFFSSNRTYFANFSDKIFKVTLLDRATSIINEVELDYWTSPSNQSNISKVGISIPEILTDQETVEDQNDRSVKRRRTRY